MGLFDGVFVGPPVAMQLLLLDGSVTNPSRHAHVKPSSTAWHTVEIVSQL